MRPGPVLHLDMDAFFAAVEVRADPRLASAPLLVGGGPPGREVVTTASYPARVFGIRSGMSLREARARCPEALFVPVSPARYLSASESVLRLCEEYSPNVEPASIDEFFLDMGHLPAGPGGVLETARQLQANVDRRERLTCSIGIGANKLQAKMATGLNKPNGLTFLGPGDFEATFWPRPTDALWGIGPESAAALLRLGIATIGELAVARPELLEPVFGRSARVLVHMARGEGGGRVASFREGATVRSMGHEMTLERDESRLPCLERCLLLLADKLSRRLRHDGRAGHVVTLRLRWSDRTTITRQTALPAPVDDDRSVFLAGRSLLRENLQGHAVRLIGLNVGHLVRGGTTFPLFEEDQRRQRFLVARDRVRDRFGERTVMPAGVVALIQEDSIRGPRRR